MTSFTGTVVARYRQHCLVEETSGRRISCQLKRRSLKPVVGDQVGCTTEANDGGILTELLPRHSELVRTDSRGRREVIAANVTQLVIVTAHDPLADWFLVDRYLAAAELEKLAALIVFNKIDVDAQSPNELNDYAALGYGHFLTSARARIGLTELAAAMREHRSVVIGQSGVGKSSLINALLGEAVQTVGALSEKSGQGRHTTTTAALYALSGGGELIDSPGVRDYAPFIGNARAVSDGYREIATFRADCRFPDCTHRAEPDCAVKAAVANGQIRERRYASYARLYALTEALQAGRY